MADDGLWAKLDQAYRPPQGLWQGLDADQAAMQPETYANPLVKGLMDSLATLPRRAIENSQQSLNSGNYDPGPPLEAAMLPMGTGAIAGVPVRAGEAVLGAGPIRAYHGSPHDFDAFSMDKIGTGEGAQAYGHGLYFAENPEVANQYSRVVTANQPGWHGVTPPAFDALPPNELAKIPDEMRGRLAASWQNNGEGVAKNLARKMFEENRGTDYSDALHTLAYGTEWKPPGHRYEVNINADPEHFLDWDKPLSEQPQAVKDHFAKQIEQFGPDAKTQAQLMIAGSRHPQGLQGVTRDLADAGIPGIKYLDQGSRGLQDAGEIQRQIDRVQATLAQNPNNTTAKDLLSTYQKQLADSQKASRNYVVFNDKLIDIMKKYGLAGLTPLASGLGLASQDDNR